MNPRCRLAVNSARQGRGQQPLTDAQVKAIDDRMSATMRRLAVQDPNWQGLSADMRVIAAAQSVMADIEAEAARKVANAQRQALKTAETEVRLRGQMQRMSFSRARSWADDIQQVNDEAHALRREYASHLMDAIDAATSTRGASRLRAVAMHALGVDNPAMTLDIAREIHARGKAGTGNELAVRAAKAFDSVNEAMRTRFNAAGGDVGRLDYGYMPNAWEPELVLRAGSDRFARVMLDKVDRTRYVNEDGSRMSDAQVLDFLRAAGDTIATNGANDAEPGRFKGPGARANRGSEHRQIHWKSGDAYVEAMHEFGRGSMYDALMGHIGGLSRDIALLERYGPNPEAQHRLQVDLAAGETESRSAPLVAGSSLDHHWRIAAGTQVAQWEYTPTLLGQKVRFTGGGTARFWQHARNVEVFSKLQGILLSSVSDLPTYFSTVHYNKLPFFDAIANLPKAMTPLARRELVDFMNTQGLIADTLIDNMNRFTAENVAASWSARVSNATMRLSANNWFVDGVRRAFALTMQRGVANWLAKDWTALDAWTREILLERRGLTADDWALMRRAKPEPTRWGDILTPRAIYATGDPRAAEVVKRYLAVLSHEQQMASIEADVAASAFLRRGTSPGTAAGEGARIIGQFKAFPLAMITRHWRRMMETPAGLDGAPFGYRAEPVNRLAYAAAFVVSMTIAGAITYQAKQLVSGRDPINMDPNDPIGRKFWVRAMAQGGGFGFMGDVLLRDSTDDRGPQQGLFELLGPVPGTFAEAYELTKGNADEYLAGKDTHAGAESIRFARAHLPLVNLWYAKTALDHMGLQALQEAMSPGYLSRVRNKARKDWGQDYWWAPGEGAPERGPSFEAIAGE